MHLSSSNGSKSQQNQYSNENDKPTFTHQRNRLRSPPMTASQSSTLASSSAANHQEPNENSAQHNVSSSPTAAAAAATSQNNNHKTFPSPSSSSSDSSSSSSSSVSSSSGSEDEMLNNSGSQNKLNIEQRGLKRSSSSSTNSSSATSQDHHHENDKKRKRRKHNKTRDLEKKEEKKIMKQKRKNQKALDSFDICTTVGLWNIVLRRTGLLVTLLLLQSLSQFILESYEHLISYHIVVPLFLTMLVGAGGNAGNQATVRVIAGLVTGNITVSDTWRVLRSEIAIGLVNGVILAGIGFTRVYWMYEDGSGLFWSAMAITLSLFCIVITSAVLGTLLPFLLEYLGIDREMAAPAIQVFMDICGVLITCVVSTMIIPESEHSTPHHHDNTAKTTELPSTTWVAGMTKT